MSLPEVRNLFAPSVAGENPEGEIFEPMLEGGSFRLERILSHGVVSPAGHWFDQDEAEWVMLARGEACLDFGTSGSISLTAGDHLRIPPRCRHRVESVSRDAVWLALHFSPEPAAE